MILERILSAKREEVVERKRRVPPAVMRQRAEAAASGDTPGAPRGLLHGLVRDDAVSVIAEVKRRSPSKGPLRDYVDAAQLARAYEQGGAAAVSVLTDEPFFGGHFDDLQVVRAAVTLPVLRKDFLIDAYQVDEARAWGADGVLLIAAALDDARLRDLLAQTRQLGMDALVEVHTEGELERALHVGARLIGVNNRDLRTFETTLDVTLRLARHIPSGTVLVSESGIGTRDDVTGLAEAGVDAILVGETFVRSADPQAAVTALAGVPAQDRDAAVPLS